MPLLYVCSVCGVLAEEQRDNQQDHTLHSRWTGGSRRKPRLLTALSLVAAVALALELRLKPPHLRLVQLAADRRFAAPTADAVGEGAQV